MRLSPTRGAGEKDKKTPSQKVSDIQDNLYIPIIKLSRCIRQQNAAGGNCGIQIYLLKSASDFHLFGLVRITCKIIKFMSLRPIKGCAALDCAAAAAMQACGVL